MKKSIIILFKNCYNFDIVYNVNIISAGKMCGNCDETSNKRRKVDFKLTMNYSSRVDSICRINLTVSRSNSWFMAGKSVT